MAAIVMYCPRCDRRYTGRIKKLLEDRVNEHVRKQHPDHDPNWSDGK